MSKIEMKIRRATTGNKKTENPGYVLCGFKDEKYGWFQRWYKTETAARKFAAKKGWPVK